MNKTEWQSIFRQLIARNLLQTDSEHGGLSMTAQGQAFLREKQTIRLRKPARRAALSRKPSRSGADASALPDEDQTLLAALKSTRMEIARAQGVPPYVIFHDKSLVDMALLKPASMTDMALVHGIGEQKLKKYGPAFLDVIAKFL